jgi:hypothetical protein
MEKDGELITVGTLRYLITLLMYYLNFLFALQMLNIKIILAVRFCCAECMATRLQSCRLLVPGSRIAGKECATF